MKKKPNIKAKKKKMRKHDKQKRKQVTDSSARMGRLLHAAADFHRTDPVLLPFLRKLSQKTGVELGAVWRARLVCREPWVRSLPPQGGKQHET